MSPLPAVRHVTLTPCRGEENPAVHVHYMEPLESHHRGLILDALGTYVLRMQGEAFEPEFGDEEVLLRPADRQGRLDHARFVALARHFGFNPPDGELHYTGLGQCAGPAHREPIEGVADETSHVH
ncbi:MAG: hypothetical protein ACEQSB_01500 [Undibacterium sp.]